MSSAAGYPRPIADYTDADAYPDHGDDRYRWAWEFIRRNPRYQELVDRAALGERGFDDSAFGQLGREFYPWRCAWQEDAPATVQQLCDVNRVTGPPWQLHTTGTDLANEKHRTRIERTLIDELEYREDERAGATAAACSIMFDVSAPLEGQIESAREMLKKARRYGGYANPRAMQLPSKGKGRALLQLLDGLAAGARPVEIMGALGIAPTDTARFVRLRDTALARRGAAPDLLLGLLDG